MYTSAHLAAARRHVAAGKEALRRQQVIVDSMPAHSRASLPLARSILETISVMLKNMVDHEKEIADARAASPASPSTPDSA